VHLLAVSKTKPASLVSAALSEGQVDFGENYLQDALEKVEALGDKPTWHFIGAIQSNKTRPIAENFDWVHTVASEKVARRLNDQRPDDRPPLKIFLQVNIDEDPDKSGFAPEALEAALANILAFPNLALQGLMTLPKQRQGLAAQREPFRALRLLQQRLCPGHPELSMGMSGDLEAAIAEGATWVRIGTDIFGAREMP
jgi:pyridoxal phosphate enzyme (YggS family)